WTTTGTGTGGTGTTGQPGALEHRLAGPDRIGTAIAVSQDSFPNGGSAGAVVLARSLIFPDALSGTPLACAKNAPLLLTPQAVLDGRTQPALQRVLPAGRPRYITRRHTAM